MTTAGAWFNPSGVLSGSRFLGGRHVGHPADPALDGALGIEAVVVEATNADGFSEQPLLTLNVV